MPCVLPCCPVDNAVSSLSYYYKHGRLRCLSDRTQHSMKPSKKASVTLTLTLDSIHAGNSTSSLSLTDTHIISWIFSVAKITKLFPFCYFVHAFRASRQHHYFVRYRNVLYFQTLILLSRLCLLVGHSMLPTMGGE